MDGLRGTAAVVLACAGLWAPGTAWAQAPDEDESGDVMSEEKLEALLDTPTAQPSQDEVTAEAFGPERLSSYFAEGLLAKAKAEFDRGRYKSARALLTTESPASLPGRFLQAQSAFLARDFTNAAAEFTALAEDYVPLRDHCLMKAAQAHERLRKPLRAAEQYGQVSPSSPLYPEARFTMARVLKRQLKIPEALAALQEFIDNRQARGPDALRMKALLAYCDLARAAGQYNAEHRALLEVWATAPLSPEADRAKALLRDLPLPMKWRVRRAEALVEVHQNVAAMNMLARSGPRTELPDELACRAQLTLGRALRKERQHRRAIQVLEPVARECQSPEQRPQALYLLAYSQSVVQPEAAVETYATLAHDYPEHGYADDALFFEAWTQQRLGRADEALENYEALAKRYPAGNFAAEALFRAYWLHLRKGETQQGLASLMSVEQLPEAARTDDALWRARYWQARTQENAGAVDAALARYELIATERPTAWYGLLSRTRLAQHAPERLARLTESAAQPAVAKSVNTAAPAGDEVWPLPPGPLQKDARFAAGVELLRLGQPGVVEELLAVDTRGLAEAPARLLYQTMRRTGRGRATRQVARVTLRQEAAGPLSAASRPVWEATWPLAFRPLIQSYSKAARVDPDLLQGLIREESRFNPRARSSTGALGLAQLMPTTAQAVADSLKLASFEMSSLLQPAPNIRLGAAYLGSLLKHFNGNPAYAVAAYNAGPNAVERWRKALPDAELDEWVEHIAFDETRDYVKRVLSSYSAYKLLYANEVPASFAPARKAPLEAVRPPAMSPATGVGGSGRNVATPTSSVSGRR
ncbi:MULTISPECIES: lytic transglycosylase domain-containing protein [unclassified Corallococcus]|uniref:lytic transglycosylase domain-containing protein n=1 Tax=unclassified Corallococcus TaxID=2685029 RepID=UPI001A8E72DE|nr:MULTISPECIES: transglycosylase SLT domain-containing protein [unclassified Corallococcus]MBN9684617.1 transglycosylase SLT domain-containing protein [Corallococcus sp. NCSPR001]WAS83911.1 transglycosylase SLT domain-containing protein [Corallococcus sp. NCRR]